MDTKLILKQIDGQSENFKDIDTNIFEIYGYFLEDNMIGYLLVKKDLSNINNIYIKIINKYESNGYGNKLFREALNLLKERNFKETILNIDKSNYKIINIILKNNGIEIANNNGIKEFLVKI